MSDQRFTAPVSGCYRVPSSGTPELLIDNEAARLHVVHADDVVQVLPNEAWVTVPSGDLPG